jgi:hypothetical protein
MGWLKAIPDLIKIAVLVMKFLKDAHDEIERRIRSDKLKEVLIEAKKTGNSSALESLVNK